jgi:hypothetical protein
MKCIIYHNDFVDFEILAMHTKFKKGLIAYHEINVLRTMINMFMLIILC